jgi:hypothetical protein
MFGGFLVVVMSVVFLLFSLFILCWVNLCVCHMIALDKLCSDIPGSPKGGIGNLKTCFLDI